MFLVFILVNNKVVAAHSCLTPSISCPPFTSLPPFPFSSSPGCGHPSFQIQCSPSNAIISINNTTFSLLHYEPSSSTLILSPQQHTDFKNCSFSRSISLSGSPFRVSDSSCSRLSALKPCPPPILPNCRHCPWDCKLIKNPLLVLHECGSRHHFDTDERCQSDILGFLDDFLKMGVEVEWDENNQDSYFTRCKSCRGSSGVCGYNSTNPKKPFLCYPSSQVRGRGAGLEEDPTIIYLRRHRSASLLPPVFPYEELESSTNHFDNKRKLGDGGFGSVYLGNLDDGRLVAVKHLHKHSPSGAKAFSTKSFCNEILILSSINHPNLVKLHGYCSDPRGLLLVYDYVPNDTSVATGDSTGEVWTGPQGTPGYLDPDYHKSFRLNEKSDIYSFGVVLLELITGMKAVDQKREKREMALADMVVSRIQMGLLQQVVDPVLVVDGEAMEGVGAVAELAFRCVAADKDDRPDSRDVVVELRRIRGKARGAGSGILRTSNSSNMVVPDGIGLID
ncbi:hypothetical protein K7X08_006467 [Anisodus acutangulus]|uniref:Protein kinase domain-containing protein n=1 Tax=Anisodus acutangulus TaxID=402998 RepID=A0A9Q1MW29_9SOLA|nr:hypothetical protein K7X08_006467 [Anisodus acutangulus]